MSRTASQEAQTQLGTENAASTNYGNSAAGVGSAIQPFLTGEMLNPQGLGQQASSEMLTAGAQADAGAQGSAVEQAKLRAARSGNGSAISAVQDQATRDAMSQNSGNSLKVGMVNSELKQAQSQAGAAGLSGLYGTDVNASLNALGMGNSSINAETNADAQTLSTIMAPFNILGGMASSFLGGYGKGLGSK